MKKIKLKQLLQQANNNLVNHNIIFDLLKQQMQLNQAIQMSSVMKNTIQKYGLQIPNEVDKYREIDIEDEEPQSDKSILVINDRNQKVEQSIAKVLKILFPELPAYQVEQLQTRIRLQKKRLNKELIEQQRFEIIQFDKHYYSIISSCMTNCDNMLKFYQRQKDIKMVIRYRDNMPYGRALLWTNVEGDVDEYLDRIYPTNTQNFIAYKDYAIKNKIYFRSRTTLEQTVFTQPKKLIFRLTHTPFMLPYIDTFFWYNVEENYLTTNLDNQEGNNLKKARTTTGILVKRGDEDYDIDQMINIYNQNGGYFTIFNEISGLNNIYLSYTPYEILSSIEAGNWSYNDDYWYIDDLNRLCSFNDIDDEQCPFTEEEIYSMQGDK